MLTLLRSNYNDLNLLYVLNFFIYEHLTTSIASKTSENMKKIANLLLKLNHLLHNDLFA
jgi:hypothetical protein